MDGLVPLCATLLTLLLWGAPALLEAKLVLPPDSLAPSLRGKVSSWSIGTTFCIVNYAGLNVTGTKISSVDPYDWDGDYSPAQSLDGLTLAPDSSFCTHMELNYWAKSAPFTMDLTFDGGLTAQIRPDQYHAETTYYTSMEATSNVPGLTVWKHAGADVQIVYLRDAEPDNSQWMAKVRASNPGALLSDVVMVETHDAGMSTTTSCTIAKPEWTETQALGIAAQLKAGVRIFDLRPCDRTKGSTTTLYWCHFTTIAGTSVGCDGTTVVEDLQAFSTFLQTNTGETLILLLSHAGSDNAGKLIFEAVQTYLGSQLLKTTADKRLDNMALSELAGKAIVLGWGSYIDPTNGIHAWLGYTDSGAGLHIYGSDAGTDDGSKMVTDQISKVNANCQGLGQDKLYRVCWTLTAQGISLLDIKAMSARANGYLPEKLLKVAALGTLTGSTGSAVVFNLVSMDFADPWIVRAVAALTPAKKGGKRH